MATGSNSGYKVRNRVVSAEVQRRLDAEKAEKLAQPNPKAQFGKFFTAVELKAMNDSDLVKVMLNTPHHRIHLDSLNIAKTRPSLKDNEVVKRKISESAAQEIKRAAQRAEEETKRAETAKERAASLGWPSYMDKRWFSVRVGSWKGQLFTSREDVMGHAYRKFTQEASDEQLKSDMRNNMEITELGGFSLPN